MQGQGFRVWMSDYMGYNQWFLELHIHAVGKDKTVLEKKVG